MQTRICFFGSYKQSYRNHSLIAGLRAHGYDVNECHSVSGGFLNVFRLLYRLWKLRGQYDYLLMGFPNHQLVPLARLCTRKTLIFDPFISLSQTIIEDRQQARRLSLMAMYYRIVDTLAFRAADILIADTHAHGRLYVARFGVSPKAIVRVPVGSDQALFYPETTLRQTSHVRVRFCGTYVPLQGIEYIIRAAALLKHRTDITFELLGWGQTLPVIEAECAATGLTNVTLMKERRSLAEVASFIRSADIALGIFGERTKTNVVVPHKVYDALASAVPVITADTEAVQEWFTHGENIMLCPQADPAALAASIECLADDRVLRQRIARSGYELCQTQFTPTALVQELVNAIK